MTLLRNRKFWLFNVIAIVLVASVFVITSKRGVDTNVNQAAHEIYSCPMHPSVVSDKPGKCPICHMDLQKVEDTQSPKKEKRILFYRHPMRPDVTSPSPAKDEMGMDFVPVYAEDTKGADSGVEGRAAFNLSTERQQLIGVTTTKTKVMPLSFEVRASGRAAFDPDLFTAIEEYRQALLSRSQMKDSPYGSLRDQANELVSSAKTRLKLLGLTDDQIRKVANGGVSPMSLLLPKGNVWIYAEVFEYEVSRLKEGIEAEVTSPGLSGRVFSGKVTSISPVVNAQTRTTRVRLLVPDPEGALRPDTFVNVKLKVSLGEKLAVPSDSVLRSGDENFVFVVKEEGHFEPRRVELGAKANDYYEILSGLSPNETVVTSANFLIDSESRLRGVLRNMKPPPTQSPKPNAGGER